MLDEKAIETLKSLGLTQLQAKLYVSLAKMGPTTIKSVAATSGIARQDIYRLIDALLRLGLAEKILNNPTMYKATSPKKGFNLLFENKKQEYIRLYKSTAEIVNNLSKVECYLSSKSENEQFVINTSKKLVFKKFKEQESLVKERIDIIISWKGVRGRFYDGFEDHYKLLKRGVRLSIITEKHEKEHALTEKLNILQRNPLFEIRYLSTPPPVFIVIYDKKAV